jgi:hypothetical protein
LLDLHLSLPIEDPNPYIADGLTPFRDTANPMEGSKAKLNNSHMKFFAKGVLPSGFSNPLAVG